MVASCGRRRCSRITRAREVLAILRKPTLLDLKRQLARDVFDEYTDYMRELRRPAQPSPDALAAAMHVYRIAIDAAGDVTLWFQYVLGEHTILGVLSRDCTRASLDKP